jgi:hypothetical protein
MDIERYPVFCWFLPIPNRDVGERCGVLNYSGVPRVSQRFEAKMAENITLKRQVEEIDNRLSKVEG